ncbi:MAG: CDP-alcohol phosphatidyltransferase family protein [Steroidobacteraceae bacterium]
MFDRSLQRGLQPLLDSIAARLQQAGLRANWLTTIGLAAAVTGGVCIASRAYGLGLCAIAISRLADGLDGPLARLSRPTRFGAYFDSVADFAFYAAVPLGFAHAAAENARAAATLLAAIVLSSSSFLAYAAVCNTAPLTEPHSHGKGFAYSQGLAEGGETIAVYAAMCLWPGQFGPLAYAFAAICVLTAIQRLVAARQAW